MTARRELVAAVGLCAVGAALVLLALSRAWVSTRVGLAPPLPARHIELRGSHLAPGARALALVGLAAVAAVPATRRVGRLVVGVLVALAGLGVVAVVVRALADPVAAVRRAPPTVDAHFTGDVSFGVWPYVGIVGGLALLVAGTVIAVRGRRWLELSARYDAPASDRPTREPSMWEALDLGEDPTEGAPGSGD